MARGSSTRCSTVLDRRSTLHGESAKINQKFLFKDGAPVLSCEHYAQGRGKSAQFPKIDELMSQTKKIFIKAPLRRQVFRSLAPDVPLPPEPIMICWGTWINATVYYCNNFQAVKSVVAALESRDGKAIQRAQELFSDSEMEGKLAYLKANFGFLSSTIAKLQESGVKLVTSIGLVKETEVTVGNVRDGVGEKQNKKCAR